MGTIRDRRHQRVQQRIALIDSQHNLLADEYRQLADYRRELQPDMRCRKLVFICSDERYDQNEVLGYGPGVWDVVKTAGPMRSTLAFKAEVERQLEIARSREQSLWVIDLVHEGCAGVENNMSLAHLIQDDHEKVIEENFPKGVFYTRGTLWGDTADLEVMGKGRIGSEGRITFGCDQAIKAVPSEQLLNIERAALKYISQAIRRTGAFDRMLCYSIAELMVGNLYHKLRVGRDIPKDHGAEWVAVGRGCSWMSGKTFAVTAGGGNEFLMDDVARSLQTGLPLVDSILPNKEPIVVLCTATYTKERSEESCDKGPGSKAVREAIELAESVRSLNDMDGWFQDGRAILVPAIVERDTSTLTQLAASAITD